MKDQILSKAKTALYDWLTKQKIEYSTQCAGFKFEKLKNNGQVAIRTYYPDVYLTKLDAYIAIFPNADRSYKKLFDLNSNIIQFEQHVFRSLEVRGKKRIDDYLKQKESNKNII